MSDLTTYCSECTKNNTFYCTNERKNSWHCPDYEKKLSEHERHILRIAEELADKENLCDGCEREGSCLEARDECIEHTYKWLMGLKEEE